MCLDLVFRRLAVILESGLFVVAVVVVDDDDDDQHGRHRPTLSVIKPAIINGCGRSERGE